MPIRLVWLGGLFQLVGGGDIVAGSLLMTIVADVFLAEERYTKIRSIEKIASN